MRVHVHASVVAMILTFLEFMIVWIPVKIIAARYQGTAPGNAVLNVL